MTPLLSILDISPGRLAAAKKMGADFTLNAAGKDPKTLATEVTSLLGAMPESSIGSCRVLLRQEFLNAL